MGINNRWLSNYILLQVYYKEHGNIDVPYFYEVNGIKLGKWVDTQRTVYKTKKMIPDRVLLLNDLNIDWSINDTKFLNGVITEENVGKYNEVLGCRLNHILNDLIYEEVNVFSDNESQKKLL